MNQKNQANQKICKIHQHYIAELLYISRENQVFEEICFICFQQNQEKYKINDIIPINEFIHSKQDSIINNFPPLSNEKISNFFSDFSNFQKDLEDKIKQIRNYFEKLKGTIQDTIKRVEIKVNHQIENLLQMKLNFIEIYNKISSKEQIKGIYEDNPNNLIEKLNKILKEKFKNIEQNTITLNDQAKKIQTQKYNLNFEQPDQIHQDLLYLIEKIDFFPNFDQNQREESRLEQLRGNQQQNQEDSYIETLQQLICNQNNYCTNEFITHIRQELMRNKIILNRNKFNYQINDEQKSQSFKNLQKNQLEDIRLLCNKIIAMNKNKFGLSRISNFLSVQLKKDNFKIDCPLKEIFEKYPIFEFESTFQVYERKFFKSQHQSCQINILHSLGGIEIIPINYSQSNLAYSEILSQDLNYIIRIQSTKPSNNRFGFVTDSEKDLEKNNFIQIFQEFSPPPPPSPHSLPSRLISNQSLLVQKQQITIGYEILINNKSKVCIIKSYPSQAIINKLELQIMPSQFRFAIQPFDKVTIFDFYAFKDQPKKN